MSAFSWSCVYIDFILFYFFLNTLSGGKSCSVAPGVAVPPWATETVLSPWLVADEARVTHVLSHVVWWKYIYIYICHHHYHIALVARISLTLSRHSSLSFITLGRSSGQHPVSSHSCRMYVRAGRPAFARPCVGVHKSTSLMSSSLLLQQCPACLARLTWIVFVIRGQVAVQLVSCAVLPPGLV